MPLTNKLAIKIALAYGFQLDRQKGSHQQFRWKNWEVTIPVKKEYPKGTARAIIKKIAELSNEDFDEIIKKFKIKF